jgi:hypothetical protein
MMGQQNGRQARLFYEFCLEDRVPADHLLRKIDRFLELGDLRRDSAPFYRPMGRPSIPLQAHTEVFLAGRANRKLVGGEATLPGA